MIKSGAGLLLIPDKPERREQYLKRRGIRLSIMRHYENQQSELTQSEINQIANDPQLQ